MAHYMEGVGASAHDALITANAGRSYQKLIRSGSTIPAPILTPYRYTFPIAREGWLVLLAAFVAALIATWLIGWWSIPFWIWAVFALQFFRDPARVPPADADAVISAADGPSLR
jgi:hypothetical protein